jgi:hypothetical protein
MYHILSFTRQLRLFETYSFSALLFPSLRPNLPKLQTYLRPQHEIALYPLPGLTSWDWASHMKSVLSLFTASLSLTFSNNQYHNLLPWVIEHQVHFASSRKTVIREPTLYKLLTFHNPNLISIFCRLGRLSKESVQVRDSCGFFVTTLFFMVKVY